MTNREKLIECVIESIKKDDYVLGEIIYTCIPGECLEKIFYPFEEFRNNIVGEVYGNYRKFTRWLSQKYSNKIPELKNGMFVTVCDGFPHGENENELNGELEGVVIDGYVVWRERHKEKTSIEELFKKHYDEENELRIIRVYDDLGEFGLEDCIPIWKENKND